MGVENINAEGGKRFYVYILFDYRGVPRYVGKGTGNRWHGHERGADRRNVHKKTRVIGEMPKIKVQENLTEAEAFLHWKWR